MMEKAVELEPIAPVCRTDWNVISPVYKVFALQVEEQVC